MAVTTGVTGAATFGSGTFEVRNWSLDRTTGMSPYASSQTGGHKKRLPGVLDWTATVRMYEGAFTASGIRDGSSLSLVLTQTSGTTLTGLGRAESIKEATDVEDGKPNEVEITIGADGAMA